MSAKKPEAEDAAYADVTFDTKIADYCRREGGSRSETAQVLAGWLADLERVGAEIVRQDNNEIGFRMTLRQAFEIGWDWVPRGGLGEAWLAGCICEGPHEHEFDFFSREENRLAGHPLVERVARLWDEHEKGL